MMTLLTRRVRVIAAAAVIGAAGAIAGLPLPATAHTSAPSVCTLSPSDEKTTREEHASCLSVSASLSTAPAVGEKATLRFSVTSVLAQPRVTITADLPSNLRWVSRPTGFTASTHAQGQHQLATGIRSMRVGQRVQFTGVVRAVAAGPAEVTVRASANPKKTGPLLRDATYFEHASAGSDTVFLTLGRTSRFGIPASENAQAVTARGPKAVAVVKPNPAKPAMKPPAQPRSQAPARAALGLELNACVKGTWGYIDAVTGAKRPGVAWRVEVWDNDAGTSADDLLATGLTGWNGEYILCFGSKDPDTGGVQDPYVKFVADNGNWRIQSSEVGVKGLYNFVTNTAHNILPGSTTDFGPKIPGSSIYMRAAMAFSAAQQAWNATPGACWDMHNACRAVVMVWSPDSTRGTFYRRSNNRVYLLGADPDQPMVVVHELAHSVMDDVYDDNMPDSDNCSPHYVHGRSSKGCAWSEGFADWMPTFVFNTNIFQGYDLENANASTPGWDHGDAVEGRVAGALYDITDSRNDGTDHYGEGINNLWATFQAHHSKDFWDFWTQRKSDGFNVGTGPRNALHQNTIYY